MPNSYFQFKQFMVHQDRSAMKVTTDACLFGAWVAGQLQQSDQVMDVGTGTGLLSLMVVQRSGCKADAIEIDELAAGQAGENVAGSLWKENISVIHGDIREFKTEKKYDVIISNPPFYENELSGRDGGRNTAHHGTHLRLVELFTIVKKYLQVGGSFYCLLPFKRWREIEILFRESELKIVDSVFVKQTSKHDCFRVLVKAIHSSDDAIVTSGELIIKDRDDMYTEEFRGLLRDYYLQF
ncbi:tRNA1(Val) (adenine(37)-N6)-methyltransferase [Ferruginibacter sp.]